MADPINKGTAYVFGVDTITGTCAITVTSYTITEKPAVEETVIDELGRTVHIRMDDNTKELSLEGFVPTTGSIIPTYGTVISYRSINWLVKETERRGEAKGFTKLSVKATAYANITLT